MLALMALQSNTSLKNNYFGGVEQSLTKMKSDIDRLQCQQADNQEIYITLMKKTKANIWRKIKEVEDGDAVKDGQLMQPLEIQAEPEQPIA